MSDATQTLLPSGLFDLLPPETHRKKVNKTAMRYCVSPRNSKKGYQRLYERDWITLYALDKNEESDHVAQHNNCSHLLQKGKFISLETGEESL